MFLSILKGSQNPLIRNRPFGKLLSIFVSEIISRSTLLARSFVRNSNLFLIEMMLRCAKISLFKLFLRSDFKWLVSVHIFLILDLYPTKLQLPVVTCPSVLRKMHCHWNIFDLSRASVDDNMLVPHLVWCKFDLLKYWCFMFLIWSVRLMFLFVHVSLRWLFTFWALYWCLSFLVMMLEIETSQIGDFGDMAGSTNDFAISPESLSDGMSLVPTWKIIWSGLPCTLPLYRGMVLRRHCNFQSYHELRIHLSV